MVRVSVRVRVKAEGLNNVRVRIKSDMQNAIP